MFRTVSLSIIRSLHTQQYTQVMLTACQPADSITCMTYTYCCVYSARLLMMDRDTDRNMQSPIAKINLRNQCISLVLLQKCVTVHSPQNVKNEYRILFLEHKISHSVQPITRLHIVSRSRMDGAIPPSRGIVLAHDGTSSPPDFTLEVFHGSHLEALVPTIYYMLLRSSPSHNIRKCLKMVHCCTPTISLFIIH